jgi:hypothetical protein
VAKGVEMGMEARAVEERLLAIGSGLLGGVGEWRKGWKAKISEKRAE